MKWPIAMYAKVVNRWIISMIGRRGNFFRRTKAFCQHKSDDRHWRGERNAQTANRDSHDCLNHDRQRWR